MDSHRFVPIVPRTPTPPVSSSTHAMTPTDRDRTPRAHQRHSSYLSPAAISRSFGHSPSSSFGAPPPTSSFPLPPKSPTSTLTPAPTPVLASSGTPTPTSHCPFPVSPSPVSHHPLPAPTYSHLTPQEIATLPPSTLRSQLLSAQRLITHLQTSLAHHNLAHTLLLLETSEARARAQVEADIAAAQIAVLRQQASGHEECRRRLRRAKRKWREENERLREQLGSSVPEGEGGLEALGRVASQVLSQNQTPQRVIATAPALMSPVAFERKRRRESRDSTISLEGEEAGRMSPTPRKKVKIPTKLVGLETPVTPRDG